MMRSTNFSLFFDPDPLTSFPSFQNVPKTNTLQPGDDPGSILTIHADPSIHARREAGGSRGAAASATSASPSLSSSSQQAPLPSSDLSVDPILAQLRSLDLGAPLLGEKAGTDDPEWAELLHAASGVKEKENERSKGVAAAAATASASSAPAPAPASASASASDPAFLSAPGSSARGQAATASACLTLRFREVTSQRSALAAQRQSLVSQRLADAAAAASRAESSIERSRDVLEKAGGAAERAAEVVGDLEGAEATARKLRETLEALAEEVEGC